MQYNFEFQSPKLEDKDMIVKHFKENCSRSCERTFVNIFLWSRYYDVKFTIIQDTIVFKAENEGKFSFAFPAGNPENVKEVIEILEVYSGERGQEFSMYNITPTMYQKIEEWFPGEFEIEYNRDIADYIYETEKLTTLAGKKLHAKRNHINKFHALYEDWSYETLCEDNIEECFQMALRWRELNACDEDEEKVKEMTVTMNALRLFRELDLVGGILRVNREIVAFTIGEPICGDTFVVHIEKAIADIQGAYPMINQQFVIHECQDYAYINREEDTGSEGLRKAKLSYRPVFLEEKGRARKIPKI